MHSLKEQHFKKMYITSRRLANKSRTSAQHIPATMNPHYQQTCVVLLRWHVRRRYKGVIHLIESLFMECNSATLALCSFIFQVVVLCMSPDEFQAFKFSGKPNPAKFSSASRGSWKDSYNISWAVESFSPIEEYKLLFRRLPENPGSEDGHPQPLHHQSQKKFNLGRVRYIWSFGFFKKKNCIVDNYVFVKV